MIAFAFAFSASGFRFPAPGSYTIGGGPYLTEEALVADATPKHRCESCPWRQKYIDNPKSFSGRLWRWHTYICPGWKAYQRSLAKQGK